jgi:hypothetical protein
MLAAAAVSARRHFIEIRVRLVLVSEWWHDRPSIVPETLHNNADISH